MSKEPKSTQAYVRMVREETQSYLHNLLQENEKMRSLTASFKTENEFLQKRMQELQAELNRHQLEQNRLHQQLSSLEAENRRFSEDYVHVEKKNNNLANLYVASYQLHGTLDRQELLAAIDEIVINLVGSEQLAVFELNEQEEHLSLINSIGIDDSKYQTIPLGVGTIGQSAVTGEMYVAPQSNTVEPPPPDTLTACVPLVLEGKTLGVIAIFQLLKQKPRLEDVDRELLEMLATHAATALYCTRLHALYRNGYSHKAIHVAM